MSSNPSSLSTGELAAEPYRVFITTFLAMFLRTIGSLVSRREAREFLAQTGKYVEVFLPFFKWFDSQGNVVPDAIKRFRSFQQFYGMEDFRVVHTGYAGQGFLLARFFMNPADPRSHEENVNRIRRELGLLALLKKELGINHPVLYVLHCGRRERGIGRRESFQASVATIRDVLDDALAAGVCVSLENLYSHHGEESIGTMFGELKGILTQIGLEWVERGVLGWTFDIAHALLTYSGNYNAIERELKPLLPMCVHIHLNHPRTIRYHKVEKIFSEWARGDDYHAAPARIPQRERYWSLIRDTLKGSRVSEWRTITYEVNWSLPVLRIVFGGSPLSEVRVGFEALDRFCNHPTEAFDVSAIERYIDDRLRALSSR